MNTILIPVLFVAISMQLCAQTPLTIKSVNIFKNGTCLFTKEGTVSVKNGAVRLPVPPAINSTYWLATPNEKLIKSVVYGYDTLKVQRAVTDINELLQLNIGKRISFEVSRNYGSGLTTRTFSGTLLGAQPTTGLFKMRDETGIHYMPIASLKEGNFSIENAVDMQSSDSISRYAVITPVRQLSEMTIQETSMQSNVQWIPSYFIRLGKSNSARIEMKALIENFSDENIRNADAEIIVGVPQLAAGMNPDPATTLAYTTQNSGFALTPSGYLRSNFGASYGNTIGGSRTTDTQVRMDGNDNNTYNTEMYDADGEQSNGIYVYKLGAVSVEKMTKASYPVFASSVEYRDLHECEIPDATNFSATRIADGREGIYDVYRSIELKNITAYPLTTAGVMVTDENGRFIAQETLKYIPKNGKGLIRLQKAINVSLKCSEEEVQRTENVKRIGKVNFSKVRIRGTIVIENFDNKDVAITVKKNATGIVVQTGGGKANRRSAAGGMNPNSVITYDVNIAKD
ncbi:MAG: hypothetical protein JNL32_07040, partial [Candidatus Kapabacteria bacterium]|nr:hypothetical protein [Candidatus Kapabacteria bacterium]